MEVAMNEPMPFTSGTMSAISSDRSLNETPSSKPGSCKNWSTMDVAVSSSSPSSLIAPIASARLSWPSLLVSHVFGNFKLSTRSRVITPLESPSTASLAADETSFTLRDKRLVMPPTSLMSCSNLLTSISGSMVAALRERRCPWLAPVRRKMLSNMVLPNGETRIEVSITNHISATDTKPSPSVSRPCRRARAEAAACWSGEDPGGASKFRFMTSWILPILFLTSIATSRQPCAAFLEPPRMEYTVPMISYWLATIVACMV
mmetsp:Transcript_33409/g.84672  ORF Transcript_33409/g.84672 Transcript_33409/m.84672 type:complete len:261 (-) Transcript_33409:535-1317(-)